MRQAPPNSLLFVKVLLPRSDDVEVLRKPAGADGGSGGVAEEEGAYSSASVGKIVIEQQIRHAAGDVHRARYAPHHPDLIATKSPAHHVCVFDRTKYTSQPVEGDQPTLLLEGHSEEGYGLAWSPHKSDAGCVLSGSNDGLVLMWNVEQAPGQSLAAKKSGSAQPTPTLQPLHSFRAHTDIVEDLSLIHI